MIYYIITLAAVIALALQFAVTKLYQLKFGSAITASLLFTSLNGIAAGVMFLALNGFKLELTPFSAVMALIISVLCASYTLVGFKIMTLGTMSVYTMFLMLGGMLLPYLFGVVWLDEPLSVFRIIGVILLIVSLALPCISEFKSAKALFLILCGIVFVMNGFVSITSKIHQIEQTYAVVEAGGFVVLTNLFNGILSAIVLTVICITTGSKPELKGGRMTLLPVIVVSAALLSGGSYMLQLIGASNLPASVLYPMITGGSMVLTAVAARVFYKEKPDKLSLIGLILAFFATLLFLF